jgi:phosphoglycerate dehydrogenase-like enzyme
MAATLFLTHRGARHQQRVLSAAPPELQITLLRDSSKADILALLPEMEFLITEREDEVDRELIHAAGKLRLIQRLGSQTYDIDLDAAQEAGIPVCFWPDFGAVRVAEHCMMQILDILKKTREMNATIDQAEWEKPPQKCDEDSFAYNWSGRSGITTLYGKTVGILGFGEIGRVLAGMLKGFGCRVLYHKRRRMAERGENELSVTFAESGNLIKESDVLVCLLPFDLETAQSINAEVFSAMKKGTYFTFCGGSGMVNENDLVDALRSGHLAGAALDTYTYEPLPKESPLLALRRESSTVNLLLTPHVGAGTEGSSRGSEFSNLLRCLAGEPLLYRIG